MRNSKRAFDALFIQEVLCFGLATLLRDSGEYSLLWQGENSPAVLLAAAKAVWAAGESCSSLEMKINYYRLYSLLKERADSLMEDKISSQRFYSGGQYSYLEYQTRGD